MLPMLGIVLVCLVMAQCYELSLSRQRPTGKVTTARPSDAPAKASTPATTQAFLRLGQTTTELGLVGPGYVSVVSAAASTHVDVTHVPAAWGRGSTLATMESWPSAASTGAAPSRSSESLEEVS